MFISSGYFSLLLLLLLLLPYAKFPLLLLPTTPTLKSYTLSLTIFHLYSSFVISSLYTLKYTLYINTDDDYYNFSLSIDLNVKHKIIPEFWLMKNDDDI